MILNPKNFIPLIIVLLFLAGCENPFSPNEIQLDSSELEQFSSDLEIELGLSGKNTKTLRKALGRHGSKGRWEKDPGFIWKLAAELQETLSDEAKEKVFDRLNKLKKHSKDDRIDQSPKDRDKHNKESFNAIQKVLSENQKEEFNLIMENHRSELSSIIEAIQSGEITRDNGEEMIKELDESLKSSIDSLLTDEQKSQLKEMKKEFEAKKKAFEEQVKLAKMEALELTNDQIITLDEAQEKLNSELGNIKFRVESGELSREEGKIAFELAFEKNKNALSNIWTDKQVEIIKFHRFLQMRWHFKSGKIKGEDGKGGRGG
tara:strand:+ start:1983 stop:2936 length:954 start_codon:yes stop_codon:yes gene_type:complete